MSGQPLTPEQVVCAMSCDELRELLTDLQMESTVEATIRLKRLVQQLGRLEDAIAALQGGPAMKEAA